MGAIALSLASQVAVVHVTILRQAFEMSPLGVADWALCFGLASVVLWADEVKQLIGRRVGAPITTAPVQSAA